MTANGGDAAGDGFGRLRAHPRLDALLAVAATLYSLVYLVGHAEADVLVFTITAVFAVSSAGGFLALRTAWSTLHGRGAPGARAHHDPTVRKLAARVLDVEEHGRGRGRVELRQTDGERAWHEARVGVPGRLFEGDLGVAYVFEGRLLDFLVLARDPAVRGDAA